MVDEKQLKTIDSHSPYYLYPASNTNLVRSLVELYSDNYTGFKPNSKLGFLDGSLTQPSPTSTNFAPRVQVNSMLTTWMQNTLETPIRFKVPIIDNVKDM